MSEALRLAAAEVVYPTLPGQLQRSDVERILTAVSAALRMSAARLRALLLMIQCTRPRDWVSHDRDAVCFLRQSCVAARLGITPRALRNHEAALERQGMIRRDVAADGGRGCFAQGAILLGISFAPLIEMLPRLQTLQEKMMSEEREIEILRRQCSASRRGLTQAISRLLDLAPKHPELPGLLRFQTGLPRRYDGLRVPELEELKHRLSEGVNHALRLVGPLRETSGVAEVSIRPHVQDTKEEYLESGLTCAALPVPEAMPRKEHRGPDDTVARRTLALQPLPVSNITLSPGDLYHLASDDMKLYLDVHCGGARAPKIHGVVNAVTAYLPNIGIGDDLWRGAVFSMGEVAAALSVIVIDANRHRAIRPVRNPGGMLRRFIRLTELGRLNLEGSLLGLARRSKSGIGGAMTESGRRQIEKGVR